MTNTPQTYKLTDNVREYFEFDIDGIVYKMRYPNGEQRKQMADLGEKANTAIKKAELAQEQGDDAEYGTQISEAQKHGDAFSKFLNSLISTDAKDAPAIDAALEKQPTPVLKHFQQMLQAELSIEAPKR